MGSSHARANHCAPAASALRPLPPLHVGKALAAADLYRLKGAALDKAKVEVLEEEAMLEEFRRMTEPNAGVFV